MYLYIYIIGRQHFVLCKVVPQGDNGWSLLSTRRVAPPYRLPACPSSWKQGDRVVRSIWLWSNFICTSMWCLSGWCQMRRNQMRKDQIIWSQKQGFWGCRSLGDACLIGVVDLFVKRTERSVVGQAKHLGLEQPLLFVQDLHMLSAEKQVAVIRKPRSRDLTCNIK